MFMRGLSLAATGVDTGKLFYTYKIAFCVFLTQLKSVEALNIIYHVT